MTTIRGAGIQVTGTLDDDAVPALAAGLISYSTAIVLGATLIGVDSSVGAESGATIVPRFSAAANAIAYPTCEWAGRPGVGYRPITQLEYSTATALRHGSVITVR